MTTSMVILFLIVYIFHTNHEQGHDDSRNHGMFNISYTRTGCSVPPQNTSRGNTVAKYRPPNWVTNRKYI